MPWIASPRIVLPKGRRNRNSRADAPRLDAYFPRTQGQFASSILCYPLGHGSNEATERGFRLTRDLPVLSYNLPLEFASRVRGPVIWNVFSGRSSASLRGGDIPFLRIQVEASQLPYNPGQLWPAVLPSSEKKALPFGCPGSSRPNFVNNSGCLPRTTVNRVASRLFNPLPLLVSFSLEGRLSGLRGL